MIRKPKKTDEEWQKEIDDLKKQLFDSLDNKPAGEEFHCLKCGFFLTECQHCVVQKEICKYCKTKNYNHDLACPVVNPMDHDYSDNKPAGKGFDCSCHCHHREARICPDNTTHPTRCQHCAKGNESVTVSEEGMVEYTLKHELDTPLQAWEKDCIRSSVREELALQKKQIAREIYQWAKQHNNDADLVSTFDLMTFLEKKYGLEEHE